jgi:hypothetical protein
VGRGVPSNACLGKLIETNNYGAAKTALDSVLKHGNLSWDEVNTVYDRIVAASASVNGRYDAMLARVQARNAKPVKVTPPYQWYQTLSTVVLEIKYANRFDVAGCAALYNETVQITKRSFYVAASCAQSQDTNLLYELDFQFWGAVNTTSYKFEKRPVGKFYFVF